MQTINASAVVDRDALDDNGMPTDEPAITIQLALPEDVPRSALDWIEITEPEPEIGT
jgi:hypothetical protein